ncbi:MAG: hypothetical protein KKI06_11370 [Euryarchaeota archaeon]|nr:hypothetical protein [Euryarchaeota archaeon]MCG2735767.1 hypothetical protein [Candidatus Methanoperedenaceae archaeon]
MSLRKSFGQPKKIVVDSGGCGEDAGGIVGKVFKYDDYLYLIARIIMIQNQKTNIKPEVLKNKNIEKEFELKAINRILDRRYEVLIELS